MLKPYQLDAFASIDETRKEIDKLIEAARLAGRLDAEIGLYGPQSRVLTPIEESPHYYCPFDVLLSLDQIRQPEENRKEISRQLMELARVIADPEQHAGVLTTFAPRDVAIEEFERLGVPRTGQKHPVREYREYLDLGDPNDPNWIPF